ncbi:hypothetical protein EAO77_13735 [Streptomyces sp. t39]|nr:hypothetical protein EAO77_13735 [Streptomyces sp. t39]
MTGWGAGRRVRIGIATKVFTAELVDAATVHPTSRPAALRRRHGAAARTRWRTRATAATFPEAVREIEEVVPVNAVSTWVLPSGVTVGRWTGRPGAPFQCTPERHDHARHFRAAPRRRRPRTRIHPR